MRKQIGSVWAHIERKQFSKGLSTWNGRWKESKRKAEVKVHGWYTRRDWMRDRGGRAEAG